MTKQRSQSRDVFLLTASPDSFLMLFVDARIYQGNERILCPCRKDAIIYRTNSPVEANQQIHS